MNLRLMQTWEWLRSSYWFIPSLMCVGAVLLALSCIWLDHYASDSLSKISYIYSGSPDGARAVLTTIAGSMIGVAGVVFSITTVLLTLASNQFGPRLVRNYVRDRSNHVVLGTFLASFLYCLIVLETVHGGEESPFVPRVSVMTGMLLAVVGVGMLIYFIQHMATSVQAPQIVENVSDELLHAIDRFIPAERPDPQPTPDPELLAGFESLAPAIAATQGGYVVAIHAESLCRLAQEHDVTIRLVRRPGHFLIPGERMAQVLPPYRASEALTAGIRGAIVIGRFRASLQDVEFCLDQLVEVAVRSLSPGINDPFTAVHCIDVLSEALARVSQRPLPSPYWFDEAGTLRLCTEPLLFSSLMNAAINQIRQFGASAPAVLIRVLESLLVMVPLAERQEDVATIGEHAELILAAGRAHFSAERDIEDLEKQYRLITARIAERS